MIARLDYALDLALGNSQRTRQDRHVSEADRELYSREFVRIGRCKLLSQLLLIACEKVHRKRVSRKNCLRGKLVAAKADKELRWGQRNRAHCVCRKADRRAVHCSRRDDRDARWKGTHHFTKRG